MVKLTQSLSLFRANELVGAPKRKRGEGGSSPDANRARKPNAALLQAANAALLEAAKDGSVEDLIEALNAADVDATDAHGRTALMYAASLTWGPSAVTRKYDEWQRLYERCVSELLERGADPNRVDDRKRTALSYAAEFGKIKRLKALLEKGANPNISDADDKTALMHSLDVAVAAWKRLECVKALLENEATPDQQLYDGSTALILAARRNFFPCLDALLEKGADPNLPDDDGWTALMWAAIRGASPQYGAGAYNSCLKLLAEGAETNQQNHFQRTALMYAAESGSARILEALLEKGADPNLTDVRGWTALIWANLNHHTDCVNILTDAAAKENQTDPSVLDAEITQAMEEVRKSYAADRLQLRWQQIHLRQQRLGTYVIDIKLEQALDGGESKAAEAERKLDAIETSQANANPMPTSSASQVDNLELELKLQKIKTQLASLESEFHKNMRELQAKRLDLHRQYSQDYVTDHSCPVCFGIKKKLGVAFACGHRVCTTCADRCNDKCPSCRRQSKPHRIYASVRSWAEQHGRIVSIPGTL